MQNFIFTCGDINGIGPEICVKAVNRIYNPSRFSITIISPLNVFRKSIAKIKPAFKYSVISESDAINHSDGKVKILDLGTAVQNTGIPTADSGEISVKAIRTAADFLLKNGNGAVITAPVSKTAFELAGYKYPGQTELFAELSGSNKFMMMFLSPKMKCGLSTIHLPIKEVPSALSKSLIKEKIKILYDSLSGDFGIENPAIAVLGLNPHAGEEGRIGREEIKIISPAVAASGLKGVDGPFVPDAFFGKHLYRKYDAVLGMYHDQLLIPFKMLNFDKGVNYTAGLQIVRTSPDHGTAFDIAGKGIASEESMVAAFNYARKIAARRERA